MFTLVAGPRCGIGADTQVRADPPIRPYGYRNEMEGAATVDIGLSVPDGCTGATSLRFVGCPVEQSITPLLHPFSLQRVTIGLYFFYTIKRLA